MGFCRRKRPRIRPDRTTAESGSSTRSDGSGRTPRVDPTGLCLLLRSATASLRPPPLRLSGMSAVPSTPADIEIAPAMGQVRIADSRSRPPPAAGAVARTLGAPILRRGADRRAAVLVAVLDDALTGAYAKVPAAG